MAVGGLKPKKEQIRCTMCGKDKVTSNYYEASPSSVFKNAEHGKTPFCKKCLKEKYIKYYTKSSDTKWAIYKMCQRMDIAYIDSTYDGSLKRCGEEDYMSLFGHYMTVYNSFAKKNNLDYSFDNSEAVDFSEVAVEVVHVQSRSKRLSKDEKEDREEIIQILQYDPFDEYSSEDQKFLYGELKGYIGDNDDIINDPYLMSQIIQICSNNSQITKYNKKISALSSDINSVLAKANDLKLLNGLIKDIVTSNDKIAKENGISLIAKRKTTNSNNKNTLTGLIKELNDYNYDEVEIDFYDQMKAYGMQRAANISMKAISEQIDFGENDMADIIGEQRDLIKALQDKVLDLEELNRIYYKSLKENNIKIDESNIRLSSDIIDVEFEQDFYDENAIPEELRDEYGGEEDDLLYLEDNLTKAGENNDEGQD